ncbi:MAG: methylated-DNA--[protein]-cysteine S-methyltransferase [Myxococcales bacterium]|jgi:methylated-DNA-[protein]-cysteine S-methyltransferase
MPCAQLDVSAVDARLWIEWSERGLRRIQWSAGGSEAAEALGADHSQPGELPDPYRGVLVAYLKGDDVDPGALPLDLEGTAFQRRVWGALRRIPRGAVRSYAGIASDVGSPRGMRAVGAANGKNPVPIVVPCHRVVEQGMGLGGYTGGLHIKRFLLELEGVRVVGDQVQPGQLDLL